MIRPLRSSTLPPALVAAMLLAGAEVPVAAQTYKIVGPDGRITYSDRKPTDPKMQSLQLGHEPPPAPLFTPGALSFEPQTPATVAAAAAARRAQPAPAFPRRPPVGATGVPFPPGLTDAVLNVIGRRELVQAITELCTHNPPASPLRYENELRDWKKRNAPLVGKSERIVFGLFTTEQRELLRATVQSQLQDYLAATTALPVPARIAWCDRSADNRAKGGRDAINASPLSGPVMNFPLGD